LPAYRFIVSGRVQGVGYRYFALHAAEELKLAGFARNQPGGTVEVVAEGGDADLDALEARLREGPSFSSVESVERVAIEVPGHRGFEIR